MFIPFPVWGSSVKPTPHYSAQDFYSGLLRLLPISRHPLHPFQDIAYWHRLLCRQIIKHSWFCHYSVSRPSQIPFPMKFKLSNQAFKCNFLQQILKVLQLTQFHLCHEPCLPLLSLMYPSFKSDCTTSTISAVFLFLFPSLSSYDCLHLHCLSSDRFPPNWRQIQPFSAKFKCDLHSE